MKMRTTFVGSMTLAGVLAGCGADDPAHFGVVDRDGDLVPRAPVQRVGAPLAAAYCEIDVTGTGVIGMEDDYLPHVIQCENGGANLEALKAQAIAARSVAYYAIATDGGICDGQGCQVYSCGADPEPIHYQAVNETSGQYLNYNDTLTYAFFVAGDSSVSGPGCMGVDANAATEHWVTYNGGKTGNDVEQTALGFIFDPGDGGYGQNRGCMGQWSARCLENDNGEGVTSILQFFYGDDIGITQAAGDCVMPLPGDTTTGVVDPTTGAVTDATATDASSSGGETAATTMPASTTIGGDDTTGGASLSGGGSSSADAEDDGTQGDGPSALPDTFGEGPDAEGCGCAAPAGRPFGSIALALVLLGARRRRTK